MKGHFGNFTMEKRVHVKMIWASKAPLQEEREREGTWLAHEEREREGFGNWNGMAFEGREHVTKGGQ